MSSTDSLTTPNSTEAHKFMSALSRLVAPERAPEALEMLEPMLKLLRDVPDRAWSSRSCLEAVATVRARGVPSFAEVRKAISQWIAEHATPRTDGEAERAGLSGADALWFRFYQRRRAEAAAADEHRIERWGPFEDPAWSAMQRLCSLVRQQSPDAWRVISGSDGAAPVVSDEARAAMAEVMHQAALDMAVPRDTTPRSASIADQMAEVRAGAPVTSGRKPGQVTPEQLRQIRENAAARRGQGQSA